MIELLQNLLAFSVKVYFQGAKPHMFESLTVVASSFSFIITVMLHLIYYLIVFSFLCQNLTSYSHHRCQGCCSLVSLFMEQNLWSNCRVDCFAQGYCDSQR